MLHRLNHISAKRRLHDAEARGQQKGDPTGTGDIRRRYRAIVEMRWRKVRAQLRSAIMAQDMLGLSPEKQTGLSMAMQAMAPDAKIRGFQIFIDKVLDNFTLEHDTTYLDPMIFAAYNRAVKRAVRMVSNSVIQPEQPETLAPLTQLVMAEMQGINEAVSQRIVRAAADAVLNRATPQVLFAKCAEAIDKVGIPRSGAMVDLMIVKAHAAGTLDIFEAAGVEKVALLPETIPNLKKVLKDAPAGFVSKLSRERIPSASTVSRIRKAERRLEKLQVVEVLTAGDDLVCPVCEDIEGDGPYTINQARTLIPAHPHCRCSFIPA